MDPWNQCWIALDPLASQAGAEGEGATRLEVQTLHYLRWQKASASHDPKQAVEKVQEASCMPLRSCARIVP